MANSKTLIDIWQILDMNQDKRKLIYGKYLKGYGKQQKVNIMANRKTTAMFRSSGYDLFLPGVRHVPGAMYSKHKIHKIHKYKYKYE